MDAKVVLGIGPQIIRMGSDSIRKAEDSKEVIYKEESYQIIGPCMEVHKELGPGFLEPVYQEAVSYELGSRNIPFEKRKSLEDKL